MKSILTVAGDKKLVVSKPELALLKKAAKLIEFAADHFRSDATFVGLFRNLMRKVEAKGVEEAVEVPDESVPEEDPTGADPMA